jgi:hypothetical protein
MSGNNETLTINLNGYTMALLSSSGTVSGNVSGNVLDIGGATNTLNIANSGSIFINEGQVTLEGGSVNATSVAFRLMGGAEISGYGTFAAASIGYTGTAGSIIASGGVGKVLHVSVDTASNPTNIINYQIALGIDDSTGPGGGGDLKLSGTAQQSVAIKLDNSNQTLEIASDGQLNITAQQSVTEGTIQLDGGNAVLQDKAGVTLSSVSYLTGAGQVNTGSAWSNSFTGAGTVTAQYLGASSYTLTFNGGVDLAGSATSFKIDSGATLAFLGAVGTSGAGGIAPTINFSTSGAVVAKLDLSLAAGAGFYGVVQDFHNFAFGSDQILVGGDATNNTLSVTDASGIAYVTGDTTAFTYVSVKNGSTLIDRINMGSYLNASHVQFLGTGQQKTLVTTEVICFMAGTMIRTPDGEVAVETLARGDLVLTAEGLARPVSWLGRQTVSTRFADPLRVLPIRIKAGALAENVPARDLLLSPDHAVLVDGGLIHAGALVNGASILRETAVPEIFTYFHVELDDHSLVLAENTPAETFVDNVERLAFDNWAEYEALYPEGKSITELPYPRAKGRRQVPVYVRVLLAERAEIIGASTPAAMVA